MQIKFALALIAASAACVAAQDPTDTAAGPAASPTPATSPAPALPTETDSAAATAAATTDDLTSATLTATTTRALTTTSAIPPTLSSTTTTRATTTAAPATATNVLGLNFDCANPAQAKCDATAETDWAKLDKTCQGQLNSTLNSQGTAIYNSLTALTSIPTNLQFNVRVPQCGCAAVTAYTSCIKAACPALSLTLNAQCSGAGEVVGRLGAVVVPLALAAVTAWLF
ncbi:hypothetical protein HDU96_005116 [Phlyctochytrium bullatum]|nr:hypothetical protein HDU96_005116 [Phlyctochytrium bullatum]